MPPGVIRRSPARLRAAAQFPDKAGDLAPEPHGAAEIWPIRGS